ncbi:MAG TPA: hypothetical protein VJC06_03570 [Candidatus Paceibacterota bacterium]
MSGGNIVTSFLGQIKDNVSAIIFPKTEREIIIDNLNSDYQYLDKFFAESAPTILSTKNVTENDKTAVKKAMETFNNSKNLISNLSKLEKEEKGPIKTVGSIIEKILNIYNDSSKNSVDSPNSSDTAPTNIPPQCRLECSK